MTANESGRDRQSAASEPPAVPPETAAELVELERLQQALTESEERARSHREQYLRALAELDNVRKRAQRDIEAANRYGLEKFAAERLSVRAALSTAASRLSFTGSSSATGWRRSPRSCRRRRIGWRRPWRAPPGPT